MRTETSGSGPLFVGLFYLWRQNYVSLAIAIAIELDDDHWPIRSLSVAVGHLDICGFSFPFRFPFSVFVEMAFGQRKNSSGPLAINELPNQLPLATEASEERPLYLTNK